MEIPDVKKYKVEKQPVIDFFNEKLAMTFSIDAEAAKFLPEISDQELKTKKEKYQILLGEIEKSGNGKFNVLIKGILEADENEKDLFYTEGAGQVMPNIAAIKKWVRDIQAAVPEYQDYKFIGDLHTHPTTPEELDGLHPCTPSPEDIEDVRLEFENGNLSANEPFVFGIAGRVGRRTEYAFYRLIKKKNKFSVQLIDRR
jgi:hypothetical protein